MTRFGSSNRTIAATLFAYAMAALGDMPMGGIYAIPPEVEAVPVGDAVQAGEAVPVGEAVQAGEVVPVGEAVPVGDAVPVGEVAVADGVGRNVEGEGVGGGVVAAPSWIEADDDRPTTARTSLGPCLSSRPADFNLNTADLFGNSLSGTGESVWIAVKRAIFSWGCLGRIVTTRARQAVMAAARAPPVRMSFLKRFHQRNTADWGTWGG